MGNPRFRIENVWLGGESRGWGEQGAHRDAHRGGCKLPILVLDVVLGAGFKGGFTVLFQKRKRLKGER